MSTSVQPAPPMTSPPRKRRRKRWIALGIAIVALGVPLGLAVYFFSADERELAAALAETEELDPHWRWNDILARRAVIADEENASLQVIKAHNASGKLYEKFRKHLGPDGEVRLDQLSPADPLTPQQAADLRALMADCPEALMEARKLRFMPKSRMPIKYAPDFVSTLVQPVQDARYVCSFLQYDVAVRTHDGDFDGALESCRAMLNCARSVGDEPFLIALLVRCACINMTIDAIERVLAHGEPSEKALAEMQAALEQELAEPTLLVALRGERAGYYELLELMCQGKVRPSYIAALSGQRQNEFVRIVQDYLPARATMNRAAFLRMMNEMVETAKQPVEKQPAEIDRIQKAWKGQVASLPGSIPFMEMTPPAYFRAQANMRCTVAALAAERYRLRHAAWPASLDVLVKERLLSEVPLDPFDGQPMRYKVTAEGRVVYSIGDDRTDNGGNINRHATIGNGGAGTDFGFRLWDRRNDRGR